VVVVAGDVVVVQAPSGDREYKGKLHGWNKADHAIANRLWAEVNISPDFPTSQEYLATDPRHPFFGYHRVFAWNAFILQALEMTGLRKPEMDPSYKGRDFGGNYRFTDTWVKRNGQWQVVATQVTKVQR